MITAEADRKEQESARGSGTTVIARTLPWLLALGGAVGLLAATALLVEKIRVLADPSHVPSCSINPVLSCGTVMSTPQAEVFGIPNPILGVIGFSVVTTVGVALLAGARLPRWFHLGLWTGTLFGAGFVHWLIFQSLYRIGALCPYCMVVWAVTVPVFWYTTLHVVRERYLPLPRVLDRPFEHLTRYHSTVLCLWALLLTGAITQAFWTYWTTLL
ncbi:vitamin K epoxide reductase family protein [Nocardiopsis dassonvillei]|uniref:vitamin K epoxide reductase family protein n=1 Tax=Nocardiopsis dassonvillei TaxID=2014 RepID=UPI00200E76C2|nr:vitamin K epoxide reductase family protein [Nocardiopsis dassonvillei]MCK9871361.1 vitamin K epoxide reductase family protein [Nocardiopsis dassonvillei]